MYFYNQAGVACGDIATSDTDVFCRKSAAMHARINSINSRLDPKERVHSEQSDLHR